MRRRRSQDTNETLVEFLFRELPSRRREEVEYVARSIKEAGDRYDRYDERRVDWEKYSHRRTRLRRLEGLAADLASALCSLDILSHDDLSSRTGPEKIDYLTGLLQLLNQHAGALERETQVRGKPTDHATERWILSWPIFLKMHFRSRPGSRDQVTIRLADGVGSIGCWSLGAH